MDARIPSHEQPPSEAAKTSPLNPNPTIGTLSETELPSISKEDMKAHERQAKIDQATARAQKEAADAQARAAKAQENTARMQSEIEDKRLHQKELDVEQAKINLKRTKKERINQIFKLFNRVPKLVWLILAVVILIGGAYASIAKVTSQPMETDFSSRLSRIVDVNRLSTARFAYEGIAEKHNNENEVEYRVFYSADVEASFDMSKIDFTHIDEEQKIVYPILPDIQLKAKIDEDSFEFFEQNPQTSTPDVIKICRKDAANEVEKNSSITEVAKENLKDAVIALTTPLLESEGYTISWDAPPVKEKPGKKGATKEKPSKVKPDGKGDKNASKNAKNNEGEKTDE